MSMMDIEIIDYVVSTVSPNLKYMHCVLIPKSKEWITASVNPFCVMMVKDLIEPVYYSSDDIRDNIDHKNEYCVMVLSDGNEYICHQSRKDFVTKLELSMDESLPFYK